MVAKIGRWYLSAWFPPHPRIPSERSQRTLQMPSRLFYVILDPEGNLSELAAVQAGGEIESVYDMEEALKKKHSEIARYKLRLHHIDAENMSDAYAKSKDLSKYPPLEGQKLLPTVPPKERIHILVTLAKGE